MKGPKVSSLSAACGHSTNAGFTVKCCCQYESKQQPHHPALFLLILTTLGGGDHTYGAPLAASRRLSSCNLKIIILKYLININCFSLKDIFI